MARGLSLHIGLNTVDPAHYGGWDGRLRACENDARDTRDIAVSRGFQASLLLTRDATADRVLRELALAAKKLEPGDTFVLSYAGHGSQVPDANGGDEADGQDETWVLYDRMLVDDELYTAWSRFAPGVRILVISDSCHSGTVARLRAYDELSSFKPLAELYGDDAPSYRAMPPDVAQRTYAEHQSLYDAIQWGNVRGDRAVVAAAVLLLSGCQDNQTSADGLANGLFTATMKAVWNNGQFQGGYHAFWREISRRMPPSQSPNFFKTGIEIPSFEAEQPFTIDSGSRYKEGGCIVNPRCKFEIDVDRSVIEKFTPEQLQEFLVREGIPTLVAAYRKVTPTVETLSASVPRGGEVSVGASVDSKGNASVEGKVTIKF